MKTLFFLLIFLVPFSANAGMIQGKLISLKDGSTLEMRIQKVWFGSKGKMEVSNPKTSEEFKGDYIAFRGGSTSTTFGTAYDQKGNTVYGSGSSFYQSRSVPAQATLIGDKQTVLQCQFLIQAGMSPHGGGTCKDNHGEEYSLQF